MAQIINGIRTFNAVPTLPNAQISQAVTFTCDGKSCIQLSMTVDSVIIFYNEDTVRSLTLYTKGVHAEMPEAYRQLDFGETNQSVGDNFYTWLMANSVEGVVDGSPDEGDTDDGNTDDGNTDDGTTDDGSTDDSGTQAAGTLYAIKGSTLSSWADKIRGKTGGTEKMTVAQLLTATDGLGGGYGATVEGETLVLTAGAVTDETLTM